MDAGYADSSTKVSLDILPYFWENIFNSLIAIPFILVISYPFVNTIWLTWKIFQKQKLIFCNLKKIPELATWLKIWFNSIKKFISSNLKNIKQCKTFFLYKPLMKTTIGSLFKDTVLAFSKISQP